ncbi:MAG: hypothetical protein ABI877_15185, partial [Gemmatimonadaceae bacterium]
QPGDLLLIFADAIARSWKQVVHFKPDVVETAVPADMLPSAPLIEEPSLGFTAPMMTDDSTIVRDERGVRLAREIDD